MKVYLVGGAVRDQLLGRDPKDKDYVVVGATPEMMLALGYKQVGADFPVFLDDEGTEYALARTERKSGTGYNGFTCDFNPSTTLEDDLRRRDLTINSMARDEETGELIDPFNGKDDLDNKRLRHTSEAFAEDPLRVLRVARFAARYEDFCIVQETLNLMTKLVNDGEMETLTTERVWLEMEKALMEKTPARFPVLLEMCGAWDRLFPELGLNGLNALDRAVADNLTFDERFVAMCSNTWLPKIDNLLERFKAPAEIGRLAHNVFRISNACRFEDSQGVNWLALLKSVDAYRRPPGLTQACNVARCCGDDDLSKFADCLEAAYYATAGVSFHSLTAEEKAGKGAALGEAIDTHRQKILSQLILTF